MDWHISGIYLAAGSVDVDSGQRKIEDLGPDGLAAAAPDVDILGYGWERPGDGEEAPWDSDEEFLALMGDALNRRFDTSLETLEALDTSHPEAADRYRLYIRQSAFRWLDNLSVLASGQDGTFESRVATRLAVVPSGTLLLAPEDLAATSTLANIYGDIIGAAEAAFPAVAVAAAAYPLDRCRLSIEVGGP